jgi:hypothetical protein
MSKRLIMAATAALVIVSTAAGTAQEKPRGAKIRSQAPQVAKDGWWIRVNAESEATRIRWSLTTGPKDPPLEIMWEANRNPNIFGVPAPGRSSQTVIDFPATQRSLQTFKLEAAAEPANAKASFCVFFKDRGVELFEFSGSKQSQLTQKGSDQKCVP